MEDGYKSVADSEVAVAAYQESVFSPSSFGMEPHADCNSEERGTCG